MGSRRSSPSERPQLLRGWTLWPQVLVRGAGFPFALLDETLHAGDVSAALRAVASDAKFREAVTWQNRAAVVDGLDSLLRKAPGATDSKTRKKELLVARYLQRYCAKNDTIGFFGPVGWAKWGAGRFAPSSALIEARAAFAEPWMARVLADALAAREDLRRHAVARLPGDVRVTGSALLTARQRLRLSRAELRVLKQLPAKVARIADRVTLEQLASNGIVRIGFPVAISHRPLEGWPAAATKAAGPVRAALHGVSASTLETLEAAFTSATQHAPKRHEGQTYGGRGLVYEECRRALDLELSDAMRARVARPLTVVLEVARWYTHEIAKTLLAKLPKKKTPLHVYWEQTAPLFSGDPPRVLRPALKKLRALALPEDLDAAEKYVSKRCAAPGPGWPSARHHAPDLMWSAQDAEAMLRGEGTVVLGELHPGVTPVSTLSVLAHAPDLPGLQREWARDFPAPLVSPIPWEDFARSSHDARLAKKHWHLDLGFDFESARPSEQVLRAADFDVVGRTVTNGRLKLDLLAVFERRLKMIAAAHFSLGGGVGPRRMLGDLVIRRATWRFEAAALTWLDAHRAHVDAFRAEHALPQRVFVRSPTEVKPVYVDLSAPLSLEMLARLARAAPHLTFSEMLPGPDGLWLRDVAGARYVCELRCIAVDPLTRFGRAQEARRARRG